MKHIIKKTITLMLTIIMAMGMMTFGSSKIEADDNIITSVTVNVPAPRVGESPGMPLVAEDQPYMRATSTWAYSLETGLVIPANHVFSSEEIGKTVYVYIGLSALEGSAFSDSLSVSEITIPGVKEIISIDVGEYTLDIIASFEVQEDVSAVTEYRLWVGGKQLTSKYLSNTDEGWTYDPETKTLTLNNANITNSYRGSCIYAREMGGTLTISLTGNNKVGSENAWYGIYATITPTVITGDGSLTISDVTDTGIADSGSSITIKDTTVTLKNCDSGIYGVHTLKIDNSTVTVSADDDGIFDETVTIIDSKVDVKSKKDGLSSNRLNITGDSYVSADTTDSGAKAETFAMFADQTFEFEGLDIVEPEDGKLEIRKDSYNDDVYTVVDKYGNVAPKAVISKTYTVKFVNDDGTILQEDKVPVYETPKYEGNTPTKESDDKYKYTFKGWDKEISEVKGDATYTAVYDKTPTEKPTPTPTPVTPFSIPKTGIEGPSPFYHLISLLGVCALAIFLAKKHN